MNFKEHHRRLNALKTKEAEHDAGIRYYWNLFRMCLHFIRTLRARQTIVVTRSRRVIDQPPTAR